MVRLHICWGNYEEPDNFDVPLDVILPVVYQAKVGALVLSMANARHATSTGASSEIPSPVTWFS